MDVEEHLPGEMSQRLSIRQAHRNLFDESASRSIAFSHSYDSSYDRRAFRPPDFHTCNLHN